MKVSTPDYIEERDNRYLIIWKDAPHWMVADKEVIEIIHLADGTRTSQDIANSLWSGRKTPDTGISDIDSLLEMLSKANVAFFGDQRFTPASLNPILENITINVTRRCNLRCKHCFVPEIKQPSDDLIVNEVRRFLKEGGQYLSKNLNFSILGGEPLLAMEKTLSIAKLGKELDAETMVSTNGILVNRSFAKAAKHENLIVQVSLEGSNRNLNDGIRGRGCFVKAKKGIEILVMNGVYTILSMVVRRENIDDIEDFYKLGRKLGVDEIRFIQLRRMGQARTLDIEPVPSDELVLAISNFLLKNPDARKYLKRDHYTIMKYICARSNKRAYCGTGLKTVLIDSDGEVYPCPNHVKPEFACGNLHEKTFDEIWLNSPLLNELRKTYLVDSINEECPNCPVKYWCLGGCRGETYENTSDLRAKGVGCENIRRSIIETFWILALEEEVVSTRSEYF